jgi:PAS domain S-box-containing protein
MKTNILDLIDFEKVDILLEGFNKSTGFVTAILDLDGKVLSKSGWRQMCTLFHRINPETSKKCTVSDTVLANKMAGGEKYHFYKCLNGLVDVAVPIVINKEHVANLFSGQFFFEEPDRAFFKKQAEKYGFDEKKYFEALEKVPVVSTEKVKTAMDFLLNMTLLISDLAFQKLELLELNMTIRSSEERQRMILETAIDGFWLVDIQGKLMEVNDAYCRLSGYTKQELLNMNISELETNTETTAHLQKLKVLREDRFESKHRRKDGTVYDLEISVQYRDDEGGQMVVFLRDITEQKQSEENILASQAKLSEALEVSNRSRKTLLSVLEDQRRAQQEINTLNAELEHRVEQRTEQLEAANKELEAFSYSISHDLRAPLRHINGFISLFLENKKTAITEEELGYLNIVSNSAKEMGDLIDALLSFSRLNRAEIQKTLLNSSSMISQLQEMFTEEFKSRKIEIQVNELPLINGDYQLIKQVWMNLLSNAIKYTSKKEVAKIEIGSLEYDSEVVFFVKDNGAGFNMKYGDKLFGVFQRLHKPRDFEGIGIGLANVNRIITRHGGRCWAEGELGQGAAFYFSLPKSEE